jgi:TorA maturation chaperone TorD
MTNTAESLYFRLLGALLYNEPNVAILEMLINGSLFSELPYAQDHESARKGQVQVFEWLKSSDTEMLAEQARVDYMRLLVGVGKVLAPPWGSVHLDEDRLLFNENTLRVRMYYEHYGMKLKEKYHEPDDHLGLELEFIAYLFENNKTDAARDFTEKYIVPWVFRWNEDIQKYARTDYYRGIANIVVGGIHELMSYK